jgi:hypothetical protein
MKAMPAMLQKITGQFIRHALRYYFVLAAVYLLLILLLPANSQAMHAYSLSGLEYRILYFAVALPAMAVWFAAFFGYAKLRDYARSIADSPEAGAFGRLATGCLWLAWSLPVPALMAILLNAVADQWPSFHSAAVIIVTYTTLAFSLVALSIIGMASRELLSHTKSHFSAANARSIMLLFVVGGVLYCYLTFRRFDSASLTATDNPYFLPIWLMLLTVIIPYLYAWFIGLLATYEIITYSKQVRGVLYKQALHLLVGGLITVIAASIALQYVSSVAPPTGHLSLNYRLVLITILRVIDGAGFILIALGALRLKKIEEV